MKQESNNEMDLLLRRLSRRSAPAVSNAGSHLDADELSAYAENALPATARARCTEHLVECSSCRALVVQLSSAAGVVAAATAPKVVEPAGWRKFLASFFSPMVLRYAAPALGLIVVAVIGVMVVKRDQPEASVAQLQNEQVAAPKPVESETKATANADPEPSQPATALHGYDNTEKQGRINAQEEKSAEQRPHATPAPGDATGVAAAPPPVKRAEQQPSENIAAASAPRPAPVTVTDSAEPKTDSAQAKNEEVARKRAAEPEVTVRPGETADKSFEAGKTTERKVDGLQVQSPRGRGIFASPSAGTGGATNIQKDGVDNKEKARDEDDAVERRSVAGRTFRKQGDIWVDVAYAPPRNTTDLSRGSEHYRSLIADEPGIKTIADQLGSEFIVVWKGRAYRIR